MGYLNGVYVPGHGETGYDVDKLNDSLTRLGEEHVNPKAAPYGAVGDGTTDDTPAFQAAADTGLPVVIPTGNFKFADGSGVVLAHEGQGVYGAGPRRSIITAKNAYAFSTPSGDQYFTELSNFGVTMRSGSVSGGLISAPLNAHGGWKLHRLEALGVDTNLTPLVAIRGFIGSWMDQCRVAGNGGDGVYFDGTNAVNAWAMARCSINVNCLAGTSYAGLRITNTGNGFTIHDNDFESNRGYGIFWDGAGNSGGRIQDNWFEENWNHDILTQDAVMCRIRDNMFEHIYAGAGAVTGARNIKITEAVPTRRNYHIITGNAFANVPAGGYCIELASGVSESVISYNRGVGLFGATILDNGTRTRIEGNDSGGSDDIQLPLSSGRAIRTGSKGGVFRIKGDVQTGDDGDPLATGLFAVQDSASEEYFAVTRKGYGIFHTPNGDLGTGQMPTNAFAFFWNESTGKVAVRYRANGGSTATQDLW